ncbi:RBR-type E3 ubiquitin transferase [Mycena chlorophos]|uniref:RBR-type E3 ubiquitin transferase n=1 Tax=Mycena chlorophos TaxID=658473 RepID=A0A8H6SKP2_MYCCL|nr:RBR-type E3 ubiquitin transferase [Mycena chlorophos]
MAHDSDVLSELLIAQILEEELRLISATNDAERMQLDHAVAASAQASGRIPKFSKPLPAEEDQLVALNVFAADARLTGDAAYAQKVQSQSLADMQYAQKIAAAEKKLMLDAEFARRLQAMDDGGEDMDAADDAERLLGREAVDSIFASDLNSKGKGVKIEDRRDEPVFNSSKRPRIEPTPVVIIKKEEDVDLSASLLPTCGICMDPYTPTYSPYTASLTATSSSRARTQFGVKLPCPSQHGYCAGCLTSYIDTKLSGSGAGLTRIFPVRCPECPSAEFVDGIPDELAARVIGPERMVLWDQQKLLHSIPFMYCPNPKCSAIVETPQEEDGGVQTEAVCPFCQLWMCVACKVAWHRDLTCEEYQALPPDERSPEDRLLMELAKAKQWRRCPHCSSLVELVSGCNHMTCRCGTHFCFKCGALSSEKGLCTRQPPCDLWDEDMLLEERERERERNRNAAPLPAPARAPAVVPFVGGAALYFGNPAPIYHAPPPAYHPPAPAHHNALDWMDDPSVINARHPFTTAMLQTLICGYCNVRLNSLADLRFHLLRVRHHGVYACCGKFFRREVDFLKHEESKWPGMHEYQLRRD